MKKLLAMLLMLSMTLCVGYALAEGIPYVEYAWDEASKTLSSETKEVPSGYTEVEDSTDTWSSGWYIVKDADVQIDGRITVSGTVNLLLCDGAKLTAREGISVKGDGELFIYGQSEGSGELIANAKNEEGASGIGSAKNDGGTVTIHGGTINATGGKGGAGIGGSGNSEGSVVTIYGGTVSATATDANSYGIYGKAGLTIRGGAVNATANGYYGCGIFSIADVTISGGTVEAETNGGYGKGIRADNGDVTISGGTVELKSTGEYGNGIISGNVTISGGAVDVESAGDGISGREGDVTISGGTVEVKSVGKGISAEGGDVTISGGTVEAEATGKYGEGILCRNVTISGGTVEVKSVSNGIDADGGDVTISGGTVESTSEYGYGIACWNATISGEDTSVTATGAEGIGGNSVTILGGTVVAKSNGHGDGFSSSGIHTDLGDVTILGGTVSAEANCENGRGINCSNGVVEIQGGDVYAMGRVRAIQSGGRIEVGDALYSVYSFDGLSDWTPAAPEYACGYPAACFAPGVPATFKLGGGAKTVCVPAERMWLMPQPEVLGLTAPQGHIYTGIWLHDGAKYRIGAACPPVSGGETFTMETSAGVKLTWIDEDGSVAGEEIVTRGGEPQEILYPGNKAQGEFIGWTVAGNGFLIPKGRSFIADRDMTLIATYEKKPMARVTFSNPYSHSANEYYVPIGGEIEAEPVRFSKRYGMRWFFRHWTDAAGNEYVPYEKIPVTGDMTLTAQYDAYNEQQNGGNVTIKIKLPSGVTLAASWFPAGYYFYPGMQPEAGYRIAGIRFGGRLYDTDGELSLWGRDGQEITVEVVVEKLPKPIRIPWDNGVANLPKTGDPSMLGAWIALLGASAMGLRCRRKNG